MPNGTEPNLAPLYDHAHENHEEIVRIKAHEESCERNVNEKLAELKADIRTLQTTLTTAAATSGAASSAASQAATSAEATAKAVSNKLDAQVVLDKVERQAQTANVKAGQKLTAWVIGIVGAFVLAAMGGLMEMVSHQNEAIATMLSSLLPHLGR